jgi:hypothetical protein
MTILLFRMGWLCCLYIIVTLFPFRSREIKEIVNFFYSLINGDLQVGVLETSSCMDVPNMLQEELDNLGGNWLLVVDDVGNDRSIYESPIPSNKGGKLLITSRFPSEGLTAIRMKVDEQSNKDLAAKLLASKAADDPEETRFPQGCEVKTLSHDYFPNACK